MFLTNIARKLAARSRNYVLPSLRAQRSNPLFLPRHVLLRGARNDVDGAVSAFFTLPLQGRVRNASHPLKSLPLRHFPSLRKHFMVRPGLASGKAGSSIDIKGLTVHKSLWRAV
jgi:hypothetical protein